MPVKGCCSPNQSDQGEEAKRKLGYGNPRKWMFRNKWSHPAMISPEITRRCRLDQHDELRDERIAEIELSRACRDV